MVPLSWVEFKAFLWKNLDDSRAFVDIIWSKVKQDSQYQQEEVQDWASHYEQLQPILIPTDDFHAQRSSRLKRKAIVITRPSERKPSKRKSRDNNHPELHLGQFDFPRNASSSLASVGASVPSHPTHSTPYALDSSSSTPQGWQSIYVQAGRTFRLGIYLRSSTCRGIKLLSSIVTQWRGVSSRLDATDLPLVMSSASSSVLVRVLARWRAATFSMSSGLARVLARWRRPFTYVLLHIPSLNGNSLSKSPQTQLIDCLDQAFLYFVNNKL